MTSAPQGASPKSSIKNPLDNATEMQFGFDRVANVFCCGRVVAEWDSIKEFKRDYKPHKVEVVKADSPRCGYLTTLFRDGNRDAICIDRSPPFAERAIAQAGVLTLTGAKGLTQTHLRRVPPRIRWYGVINLSRLTYARADGVGRGQAFSRGDSVRSH
jgi:hypothetical protein